MVPSVRDLMQEHAHVLGQNKPPTNAPYGNTYNPNWRNHSNLQNPLYMLPKEHNNSLALPQHGNISLHLLLMLS